MKDYKSDYEKEYDRYEKNFDSQKIAIQSDSPEAISQATVILAGIHYRVGNIIANLELEYAKLFDKAKGVDMTDKHAQSTATVEMAEKFGVTLRHFEKMEKGLIELIRAAKKRLSIMQNEMENMKFQ